MNEESIKPRYMTIFINSSYTGIILGILFVIIYVIVNWLWTGVYDHEHYSYQLESLKSVFYFVLAFLMPVATGVISIVLSESDVTSIVSATLTGIISGMWLSLLVLAAFSVNSFSTPFGGELLIFSICFIIITVIGCFSAFIYYVIAFIEIDDSFNIRRKNSQVNKRTAFMIFGALLIVIAFIPPVVAHIGVDAGWFQRQPHDGVFILVTVERLNDGSIKITNEGGPSDYWLDPDSVLTVTLNGMNVTNMDIITKSGLSLGITPAEGLMPRAGSSIIISGKDVDLLESEGSRTHIVILAKDKDGWTTCVQDNSIEF